VKRRVINELIRMVFMIAAFARGFLPIALIPFTAIFPNVRKPKMLAEIRITITITYIKLFELCEASRSILANTRERVFPD